MGDIYENNAGGENLIVILLEDIMKDVRMTSSYVGAGLTMQGEDTSGGMPVSSMDRVSATRSNEEILFRFWNEGCAEILDRVKEFLKSETHDGNRLQLSLQMPNRFDTELLPAIHTSLEGYLTNSILTDWFKFNNRPDVDRYAQEADRHLSDALRKLYYKKAPRRK